MSELCYTLVETRLGWVGILGSPAGLRRLVLPQPTAALALAALGPSAVGAVSDISPFGDLPLRLKQYMEGKAVAFPDRVDFICATPFQEAVWRVTSSIPYGGTRSYGGVAQMMGKPHAARAVGQALGRNPVPIVVPCHRVVRSSGALGGFGGGLELKRRLLEMEARASSV